MRCSNCNQILSDDWTFCPFCGKKRILNIEHNVKKRGNGTGTVYKLPNGNYKAEVVIGYYKENGISKKRRKTITCKKKKDAILAIQKLKHTTDHKKSMTLFDLYKEYQATKKYDKLSQSQKDKMKFAWNKIEQMQLTKISDLTVKSMQDIIDATTQSYYPARDIKVLFSHLYEIAIKSEIESSNKSEYIELPDAPTAKRQTFSEKDIAKFWDDYNGQCPEGKAVAHDFSGYILIMIYTGMRVGELFGIKKDHVYLDKRYMVGGEKTSAGRDREIPINDFIFPIVQKFYLMGKERLIEKNLDAFYSEYWDTISRLEIRKLPPQTCRHTYFTLLAEHKVHPALIAAMGGHAQYKTAIDNYNRLSLQSKIEAANQI